MNRTIILWVIAFAVTIASAVFQRMTGPTYPVKDEVSLCDNVIHYKLNRTHSGNSNDTMLIAVNDPKVTGWIEWKRHNTKDEPTQIPLDYKNGSVVAVLPGQPPAGKLDYQIILEKGESRVVIPPTEPCVIRFKGEVPWYILIPHIITIFAAMLFSTRAGLEIFQKEPNYKRHVMLTYLALLPGGFLLGPLTQQYAFGALWTGFPFGFDLTDNKTLIALIGWLFAGHMVWRTTKHKIPVAFASLLMLIVFLIPHSVLGSELDYNKIDKQQSKKNKSELQENNSFNQFKVLFGFLSIIPE